MSKEFINMYSACFSDDNDRDFFIICGQIAFNSYVIDDGLYQYLLLFKNIDISLRYMKDKIILIFLSYDKQALYDVINKLSQFNIDFAKNAEDFDQHIFMEEPFSLTTDYQGFSYGDIAVGCDFRLFHYWLTYQNRNNSIYQITLHNLDTTTSKELKRSAQKYICYLDVEDILPQSALLQQYEILKRSNDKAWFANEIIFFADEEELYDFKSMVDDIFTNTSRGESFCEAPLAVNEYTDALMLGYHPMQTELHNFYNNDYSVVWSSYLFLKKELEFLVSNITKNNKKRTYQNHKKSNGKIFISYTSNDYMTAYNLRSLLESNGFNCWMAPDDINKTNLNYPSAILKGLEESSSIIVVFSEATNFSVHVAKEVDLALSKELLIIPLRIEDVSPKNDLKYLLALCQWLDKFAKTDDEVLAEITKRLAFNLSSN